MTGMNSTIWRIWAKCFSVSRCRQTAWRLTQKILAKGLPHKEVSLWATALLGTFVIAIAHGTNSKPLGEDWALFPCLLIPASWGSEAQSATIQRETQSQPSLQGSEAKETQFLKKWCYEIKCWCFKKESYGSKWLVFYCIFSFFLGVEECHL